MIVIGVVLLLGLLTLALTAMSFASFTSVKSHLDSFASDGDADVTRTEFDAIVVRLRVAAAAAALAGCAVFGAGGDWLGGSLSSHRRPQRRLPRSGAERARPWQPSRVSISGRSAL